MNVAKRNQSGTSKASGTGSDVSIKDVGPIKTLGINLKPGGGVTELRGPNGSGKTTATNAVNAMVTGKGSLDKRDGAISGEVVGWGARIGIKATTARSGKVELATLEGKFSITDLIMPGVKDPIAADEKRVKALISIAGGKPDPMLFAHVLGTPETFARIVTPEIMSCDDLVTMAAKIKKCVQAAALTEEREAEAERGQAAGKREAVKGVDLTGEGLDAASRRLEECVAVKSTMIEQRKAYDAAEQAAREAKLALAEKGDPDGDLATAEAELLRADHLMIEARKNVDKLESQLVEAREALHRANLLNAQRLELRDQAKQHAEAMRTVAEAIDKPSKMPKPTDAEIEAAAEAVTKAQAAISNVGMAEKARQTIGEAAQHEAKADQHEAEAERLRKAAENVDNVLSDQVGRLSKLLRVKEQRLVLTTPRGDDTLFDELSPGERTRIALDCAVEAIDAKAGEAIITLDQEVWAHLDPENREAVDDHAREKGIHVLTAVADRGALRCVPFGSEDEGAGDDA